MEGQWWLIFLLIETIMLLPSKLHYAVAADTEDNYPLSLHYTL